MRYTGTVKMLNREKLFGFIRRDDDSTDVFFHRASLRTGIFETLQEGQSRLTFVIGEGRNGKGPRAEAIELA